MNALNARRQDPHHRRQGLRKPSRVVGPASAADVPDSTAGDVPGLAKRLCPAVLAADQLMPLARMIAWDLAHAGGSAGQDDTQSPPWG